MSWCVDRYKDWEANITYIYTIVPDSLMKDYKQALFVYIQYNFIFPTT